MTDEETKLLQELEEIIFESLRKRVTEIETNVPSLSNIFINNASEIDILYTNKIINTLNSDTVTTETYIKSAVYSVLLALLFSAAPESFFDED